MKNGNFKLINDNLLIIQEKLLGNDNICKYLTHSNATPLNGNIPRNRDKLVDDKRINTFPYIHEKTDDKISFINVFTTYVSRGTRNTNSRKITLSIVVATHSDVWYTTDGLRPILIMDEIDKIINSSKELIAIGRVDFEGAFPIQLNKTFYGYRLEYSLTGFND